MDCSQFHEKLVDLLYSEEGFSEEGRAHLQHCADCLKEWKASKEVLHAFKGLPQVTPSSSLLWTIRSRARASLEQKNAILKWWKSLWTHAHNPYAAFQGLMGAGVVAALILFFMPAPSMDPKLTATAYQNEIPNDLLHGYLKATDNERAAYWDGAEPASPSPLIQPAAVGMEADLNGNQPLVDGPRALSEAEMEFVYAQRKKALLEADADALMMRGRRLKSKGRIDLALQDFDAITRFYPEYAYMGDVLMYRAQCLAFLGNTEKALESLDSYIQRYPDKKGLIEPMKHQLRQTGKLPGSSE